jgi:hypothetical protein
LRLKKQREQYERTTENKQQQTRNKQQTYHITTTTNKRTQERTRRYLIEYTSLSVCLCVGGGEEGEVIKVVSSV